MERLVVIVNKLNRRKNPVTDFSDKNNVVEIMNKGYVYEAAGEIVNSKGKWYVDRNGYCAWEKGLGSATGIQAFRSPVPGQWQFIGEKMSWAHDSTAHGGLGIVDLWNAMGVRGEQVNVLILDTGIASNLTQFTRDGQSTIRANLCIDELKSMANDTFGHGTNSASIIGATGSNTGDDIMFGIAPGVNLYIIKFAVSIFAEPDRFRAGLSLIDPDWPIDLISISFCYQDLDPWVAEFFKTRIRDQCIVLAAIHHPDKGNISISNEQYPAAFENVIPVAASRRSLKDLFAPCNLINLPGKKNWVFPGENIRSLDENGQLTTAGQSSIATPLGAGVIALFLSYMKKRKIDVNKTSIGILIKLMEDTSDHPVSVPGMETNICFCNPTNAFKSFNLYFKAFL